jgi:alpha-beta hydrolase superfamily lysophospholipase
MLAASLLLAPPLAGWFAADQLAHPPRRPLQDFHREFLADTKTHGVVLGFFTCGDGTPGILCEPNADGVLGRRGQTIRGQMVKKNIPLPPAGQIVGSLVLVHGRRGRKEDYLLIAERFCAIGFRCILFDLPAHGDHPGAVACYGVKEAHLPGMVLWRAAAEFGFDPQPCGIMGISMGGAVSIRAAVKNDAPWRASVFVSTFDTLDHVVRHQASGLAGSWGGSGLHWITRRVFEWQTGMEIGAVNSVALVSELKCPTLIAHGTSDRVIPIEYGHPLYESLPSSIEKRWLEIPGADHDNVLITDFPIYAEMAEWMLRHVPN